MLTLRGYSFLEISLNDEGQAAELLKDALAAAQNIQAGLIRKGKAITLSASELIPDIAIVERRSYGDHLAHPDGPTIVVAVPRSGPNDLWAR